jgi:hypothetical protein
MANVNTTLITQETIATPWQVFWFGALDFITGSIGKFCLHEIKSVVPTTTSSPLLVSGLHSNPDYGVLSFKPFPAAIINNSFFRLQEDPNFQMYSNPASPDPMSGPWAYVIYTHNDLGAWTSMYQRATQSSRITPGRLTTPSLLMI